MVIDLILNLALLIALTVLSGFLAQRWSELTLTGALIQGALFGGAAVIGMLHPSVLTEGVFFDGRSLMLCMCALFFGPRAAALAAVLTIVGRVWIGGAGMLMGMLVILSSTGIGLWAHFRWKPRVSPPSTAKLYLIGLVVHATMLIFVIALPGNVALTVWKQLGLPVMLLYPAATVLVGRILSDQREAARSLSRLESVSKNLDITLQSIGDAVITTDLQGRIARMNPVAEQITGWKEVEALGQPAEKILQIISGSTLTPMENPVTAVLRSSCAQALVNHTLLIARDGSRRPIADSAAPIRDEQGSVSGVVLVFSDQTLQYVARQALKDSEERLRLALTATDQGLYDLNVQTGECVVSPEYARMLGHDPAEFRETNAAWRERLHPEDRDEVYRAYTEYVAGQREEYRIEFRQRTRDGDWKWILSLGKVVTWDAEGRPLRMLGTHTDITERRRAEQKLRESEDRYRLLVEESPDAIGIYQDDRLVFVNQTGVQLFGAKTKAELLGRSSAQVIHPEDAAKAMDRIRRRLAGEVGIYPCEVRYVRLDGTTLPVEVSASPIVFHGKPAVQFIARDIAARKQAEAQVRLQSAALESAANAIVITNREGIIQWANTAFTTFTGYSPAEAVGRQPGELLKSGKHNHAFYQAMWETILAGNVWRGEMINRRKDGTLYTEEMTVTPLNDERGGISHFIAVKQDVTQRKALEEQFRQAHKMEAIGQLAGGVAHDFNNMLAVILGNATLIEMELSPAEQQHALREISHAAERATSLTRQLLTFSRRQTLQAQPLDLNDIVTGMVKMLHRIIGEDITLQTRLLTDGAPVHGDPGMLEQVLLNLTVNARDAMLNGGEIAVTLTQTTFDGATGLRPPARPGEYVRLSVSDTGNGIAPEHLPRIFEPFFTTKDVGKGTGLGLATVHGIVEQHHGWIEVESSPGEGATFHVYLPRLVVPAKSPAGLPDRKTVSGGNETILLVEDEIALRLLAARVLKRYGYRVIEAANGVEAQRAWEQHKQSVNLLLTDIVMPEGISGRELAELLRADRPGLKVIYMSGYPGDVAGRGLDLREGVNYLKKPFGLIPLAEVVRRCLDEPV